MKIHAKHILGCVLAAAVLLISSSMTSRAQPQADQDAGPKETLPAAAPDLADIVPLAAELASRLAALEKSMKGRLDISAVEKRLGDIEAGLENPADQLQRLTDSKDYKYYKLVEVKEAVGQELEVFEDVSMPVGQAIRQLGTWRKSWLAEQQRWREWHSALDQAGELDPLKSTFDKANDTIGMALDLVIPRMEAMLAVQEKVGNIKARINALNAELDALIVDERRSALLKQSPPMLSYGYVDQFRSGELWYAARKCLDEISWPDKRFFDRQGWIVLFQGVLSLVLILVFQRNRQVLNASPRWRFLAVRAYSAGVFSGFMITALFYEYEGAPGIWKLANATLAAVSFSRLMGALIEAPWKRRFVYGLMIVLIATRAMDVLSFPLPLFRLYTVSASLVGLIFCLRFAKESVRQEESVYYTRLLRLGALFFAVIMLAELWGQKALSLYMFTSLVRTIATALVFILFMYMIRGGVEWLFRSALLRRVMVLQTSDAEIIVKRVARFVNAAVLGLLFVPDILMVWGVYDSLEGATKGLMSLGFNLGDLRISVGLLLTAAGVVYGTYLVSWILQKLLMDVVLPRRQVEMGVRLSIARLVHYVIIFTGFLLALSALGFEVAKLTIMLSALGVGIGFGLQGVVNNFVSGLILLFERPIRVGDIIEIDGKWSEIKRIGIRATTAQTFDHADLIIPNADLISNQVTNWTLSNRQVRLTVPVGVAYGSDVPRVMETLLACAIDNSRVAKFPAPQVLFLSFGESTLDFELRAWVWNADDRLKTKSEINQEIDRRFREADIEIAFPQRDLHLRSLDESIRLKLPEAAG